MTEPLTVVQMLLYNEALEEIDGLLRSLEVVDYPKERWRLVIVNNHCDGHPIAEHFDKHWRAKVGQTLPETIFQSQQNNGFAGGHDSAYEISKTFEPDYVYLLNGDAYVAPGFLRQAVTAAEADDQLAIVQSRIMLAEEPTLLNSSGNCLHYLGFGYSDGYRQTLAEAKQTTKPHFYASGAGVLLRQAVLEKIGGLFYHDTFMYHEDVDVSWRARLAGFDIGYAEDSVIYHRYEFSKSIKKFYWMERNRHLMNLLNYRLATLVLIAPAALLMEVGTLLFALKGGWGREKVRSWLFFCKPSTWKMIAARRRRVARFRKVSDRELLKHMVGVIAAQEVKSPILTLVVNPVLQIYFWMLKAVVRW